MAVENKELVVALKRAVASLLDKDRHLLEHTLNERTITGRLALHLQLQLQNLHVDVEYNDNQGIPKRLHKYTGERVRIDDLEATTVYPDLIVHERNSGNNYLVIEAKKSTNRDRDRDLEKLKGYTLADELNYQLGVFLIIPVGEGLPSYEPEYLWFKRGVKVDEEEATQANA